MLVSVDSEEVFEFERINEHLDINLKDVSVTLDAKLHYLYEIDDKDWNNLAGRRV